MRLFEYFSMIVSQIVSNFWELLLYFKLAMDSTIRVLNIKDFRKAKSSASSDELLIYSENDRYDCFDYYIFLIFRGL